MIRVVCGCGRVFRAEDHHAGRLTRCPACGADLVIGTPISTVSGSGEQRSIEELPSWWSTPAVSAPGPFGPADTDEHETRSTAVFEHGLGIQASTPTSPSPPARSDRTLAGALAAGILLAIVVLGWARWESHPPAPADDRLPSGVALPRPDIPNPPDPSIAAEPRRPHPPRRLRLLVPAYFYPKGEGLAQWRRLLDAADRVDIVAIVNPESGPGAERNPDYAALLAEAEGRSARLIGYVSTQFAVRTTAEVKAEIDAWLRFYPGITGFFLDQQPTDARHSAYIADIAQYAREKLRDALIISDPGTLCDESYLSRRAADRICVFYNFEGYDRFELPAQLAAYDPSRFAAMLYQVPDEKTMRAFLREAIVKRIGSIYITDGKTSPDPKHSNPWAALPSYWDAEVQAVAQLQ